MRFSKIICSRESPVVIVQGRDKDHQKQGRSSVHGKGKINQEEIVTGCTRHVNDCIRVSELGIGVLALKLGGSWFY